jgi:hypothetical protein
MSKSAEESADHVGKIKPELAEGDLVKVASARNQPEAEFIQGLLLNAGVPSVIRRTPGFDVPDFLAAGPRDVLVPASGVHAARDLLPKGDSEPLGLRPAAPAARFASLPACSLRSGWARSSSGA